MFGLVPWRKEEERAWPVGHPLAELNREFRTLANRLFTGYPTLFEEMNPERLWNVAVDETEMEFVVKMEVPGFELEEFHLEVRDNRLFVKAEHTLETKKPVEKKEEKPVAKEVRRYERVLMLPEGLELEKAEAFYRNGVLEIRLPRTKEALGFRIPVRA